jgi:multidrug resistance protein MdtO
MPSLTSIGTLLGVVFLGALASAWVAAGGPRIAYAGFQLAFAFFLCVIQGPSPAFDLTIARDRVIGILLGNVVVYLLFTRLWPTSVGKQIDSAIATALRDLTAMASSADPASRLTLAAQVQGALGGIEQNLDLARYEPPAIRPTERWLRARRTAVQEIGALHGPLLLSAARDPASTADVARRLEQSADLIERQVDGLERSLDQIKSVAMETDYGTASRIRT